MKNDDYNKDLLGKIVELAKKGKGGEKETAIRMVKALCKKHGLDFEDVMGQGEQVREYVIYYKLQRHERVVQQIVVAYAFDKNSEAKISCSRYRKAFFIEVTQEKYIETLNAVDTLVRLYEKERKKTEDILFYGFLEKHDLYANANGRGIDDISKEELLARRAGSSLSETMEDAEIRKRLT